ncbi:uncharacterized protein LAJ45_10423 [Morchella importuna]|uniref:uncharacterized protein n=1 Tax=Morchella importuna TaxID=1174673 RepID=UPI001E8EC238|nr:uncharacterized protein LAJ45_10423 [Morchella importuna]KAH8145622.1 hypothetical protein LAJ45_10423 [Morchella importuna]
MKIKDKDLTISLFPHPLWAAYPFTRVNKPNHTQASYSPSVASAASVVRAASQGPLQRSNAPGNRAKGIPRNAVPELYPSSMYFYLITLAVDAR